MYNIELEFILNSLSRINFIIWPLYFDFVWEINCVEHIRKNKNILPEYAFRKSWQEVGSSLKGGAGAYICIWKVSEKYGCCLWEKSVSEMSAIGGFLNIQYNNLKLKYVVDIKWYKICPKLSFLFWWKKQLGNVSNFNAAYSNGKGKVISLWVVHNILKLPK